MERYRRGKVYRAQRGIVPESQGLNGCRVVTPVCRKMCRAVRALCRSNERCAPIQMMIVADEASDVKQLLISRPFLTAISSGCLDEHVFAERHNHCLAPNSVTWHVETRALVCRCCAALCSESHPIFPSDYTSEPTRSAAQMPREARSAPSGPVTSARGRKRREDGLSTRRHLSGQTPPVSAALAGDARLVGC